MSYVAIPLRLDEHREALGRLDQDHPVHPVADVHADRRGGAVVDVEAVIDGLEGEY